MTNVIKEMLTRIRNILNYNMFEKQIEGTRHSGSKGAVNSD